LIQQQLQGRSFHLIKVLAHQLQFDGRLTMPA